jgi:hypothetical protein
MDTLLILPVLGRVRQKRLAVAFGDAIKWSQANGGGYDQSFAELAARLSRFQLDDKAPAETCCESDVFLA